MNTTQQHWGELRSVVHQGRFDVISDLAPILAKWPIPPKEDERLLNYLKPHMSRWHPGHAHAPDPKIWLAWMKGRAWNVLDLLPQCHAQPLLQPFNQATIKVLEIIARHLGNLPDIELVGMTPSQLTKAYHWCTQHSTIRYSEQEYYLASQKRDVHPRQLNNPIACVLDNAHFGFDMGFEHMTPQSTFAPLPFMSTWWDNEGVMIDFPERGASKDSWREIHLVVLLECLWQINGHHVQPEPQSFTWLPAKDQQHFTQMWRGYCALRAL